jgi:hypothetical protein
MDGELGTSFGGPGLAGRAVQDTFGWLTGDFSSLSARLLHRQSAKKVE